jgi:hypothetical protein
LVQGWRERDVPIVQELLAAVEARDVRRARRAWAAELEPLLAALQEVGRRPWLSLPLQPPPTLPCDHAAAAEAQGPMRAQK